MNFNAIKDFFDMIADQYDSQFVFTNEDILNIRANKSFARSKEVIDNLNGEIFNEYLLYRQKIAHENIRHIYENINKLSDNDYNQFLNDILYIRWHPFDHIIPANNSMGYLIQSPNQ